MQDKYYCRTCKGIRSNKVLGETKTTGSTDDGQISWNDDYYIIQCLGCQTISFLRVYGDSEMVSYGEDGNLGYYDEETIYPPIVEELGEVESVFYFPVTIRKIYIETIDALKIGALILAAGGLRAIIESICNHLKIKKDSLSRRIDLLFEKGFLSENESRRLHSVRFMGNDALHEIATPKKEQLLILIEIINHLLENLFIHDKKMERIEVMVSTYESFIALISSKIKKDDIGKEFTLKQILGKSIRQIKSTDITKFESQLVKDIQGNKFELLTMIKNGKDLKYKIEKESKFSIFDFD